VREAGRRQPTDAYAAHVCGAARAGSAHWVRPDHGTAVAGVAGIPPEEVSMKAIMVMYDSLNRRYLSPYGSDWVKTPNFERLAQRSVRFTNSYVGSMPCMPARRELHTGRYNFLHRSWGPLEPFDDSCPEILKRAGVHTHLASDHYHYWEDGGCTYHTRYNTW
jgi:arylsulfatase A-like enzyme